jgi:hypothetical protein
LLEIIWPGKIKPADLSHSEENLASIIIHWCKRLPKMFFSNKRPRFNLNR